MKQSHFSGLDWSFHINFLRCLKPIDTFRTGKATSVPALHLRVVEEIAQRAGQCGKRTAAQILIAVLDQVPIDTLRGYLPEQAYASGLERIEKGAQHARSDLSRVDLIEPCSEVILCPVHHDHANSITMNS